MTVRTDFRTDALTDWLASGSTVRICGLDFVPIAHPLLTDAVQCIVKGQAAVYFLRQQPHGNVWLLKRFSPGRRPSDAYLDSVPHCLPGSIAFFTCTQRRMIDAKLIDRRYSGFRSSELGEWLTGTMLMPKVPGAPWSSIADSLRDREIELAFERRLSAAANLAECVQRLEDGGCAHRDLSSGNLFLDDNARVFVIDWDSVYHGRLPFQPNTTVGTAGYTAPFTRGPRGHFEATRSWCPAADRYALGILIAELLLTRPELGPPHEDGSLFAQAQLDDPGHEFVRDQAETLCRLNLECGVLLLKTLRADSFTECPSPATWLRSLRGVSRVGSNGNRASVVHQARIKQSCSAPRAAATRNRRRNGHRASQGTNARWWNANRESARVTCEHCQRTMHKPREILTQLQAKGHPLLCSECLRTQLETWKSEQSEWRERNPEARCSQCGETFRLRRSKLDLLITRAKPLLCWTCFRARGQAAAPASHVPAARFTERTTP